MNCIHRNIKNIWKRNFFLFLIFLSGNLFSQQIVKGYIKDDDGVAISSATVVNMSSDRKVYSDANGGFAIEAFPGNEIRFVKEGFSRVSKKVQVENFSSQLYITLIPIPIDIEEVTVVKKLGKEDAAEKVSNAVGLPKPVGKMRETPAEAKKVLLPLLLGALDVQGTYDLISGKARRQKRKYRYDDLQEQISWVLNNADRDYFIKAGIPADEISQFIEFSFAAQPLIRTYVKAKNLTGVLWKMEELIPIYIDRIKQRKKPE